MSEAFDPYHRWLGIHPKDQPPHHYRLLGIDLFENDTEVIRDAAERQMAHVRNYQLGQHSAISQKILNELAIAKACLLDRDKKAAYDAAIKAKLNSINSAAEQADLASPPPIALPWISEEQPFSADNARGKTKITDYFKIIESRRCDKKRSLFIGLGTAVIFGGVLLSIFVLGGNKPAPKNSMTQNGINKQTDPIEQSPPAQSSSNKTPGNKKNARPISGENSITTPPADNQNSASDKQGATEEGAGGDIPHTVTDKPKFEPDNKGPFNNIPPEKKPEPQALDRPNIISEPGPIHSTPAPSISDDKLKIASDQFILAFNEKRFNNMRRDFTVDMNYSWPLKDFAKTFRGLRDNYGKIINYDPDPPAISKADIVGKPTTMASAVPGAIVYTTTTPGYKNARQAKFTANCERGTIEFNIWFDLQDKIISLWLTPGEKKTK